MNRLFTNLFTNAIEASNGYCLLEVREELFNNHVRVSIKDNGEGIALAKCSRASCIPNFTTKSSGTGLGLAMCKGIIEQAKEEFGLRRKKGVGTTFHVELPLAMN